MLAKHAWPTFAIPEVPKIIFLELTVFKVTKKKKNKKKDFMLFF
jgi:hypothetical protein